MFWNRRRRIMWAAVAGAAALLAVGVAACRSSSSTSASASPSSAVAAVPSGIATVALPAGVTFNWIWPYIPQTAANEYNIEDFEMLLYRPLYYFGDNGDSVAVNYPISVANAPAYSDGGKQVTVPMKGWKWSDGEAVSAQDVIFWLNMMRAESANYDGYAPGLLPDNLASYTATSPTILVLKLKSAVSSIWFTYDQLAEITPMPMAWDVTAAGAKAGSGGCTTDSAKDKWAKCVAVFKFLTAQAKDVRTYATNPIWRVVDGPWTLSSFNTNGNVTFVPNKAYSGTPKPELAAVTMVPFADEPTEYTALKSGQINVGYIPPQDLPLKPDSRALPSTNPLGSAFTLAPSYADSIDYFLINFKNRQVGPAFQQLYVRRALQETNDQEGMITTLLRGYGYPTSGGVPNQPPSQWIPGIQDENGGQGPYPFSIANARALLTSHGWSEVAGVMTCEDPAKCGPGVTMGMQLKLTLDYVTGVTFFQQEVAAYQADAAQAGIDINLVPRSFSAIIGEEATTTWQILDLGGWNFAGPGFEPTGESLFQTGASSNPGEYSDLTEDNLINETHTSSSPAVFLRYAAYTALQLPVIWTLNGYAVQGVSSKLVNVGFSPLADFLPEYWYFTR